MGEMWAEPPLCPACGERLVPTTDISGDWRCKALTHEPNKRLYFDYELTMLLRAEVERKIADVKELVAERTTLRARVAELEGALRKTLYYIVTLQQPKAAAQRMAEEREFVAAARAALEKK
jgi:hypothetical protein